MNSLARLLVSFALVALSGCGGSPDAADGSSSTTSGSEAATTTPQPFLWEVRDGERVSHLFGTMHAGADLEASLPERHHGTLDSAHTVVLEANIAEVDAQASVRASLLPAGRTLDTILPADVYEGVSSRLAATIPETALRRMRPWVVSTLIALTSIQQLRPDASTTPIDALIGERARSRGAQMLYLETAADQLGFINEVPEGYFVASLTEVVRTPDESARETSGMVDAYTHGDADAMATLLFDEEEMNAFPEAYEILFFRRNRAWLDQLDPRMREGGLFVAVGLGHLLGDRGLVAGLASRGFVVTRLR